MAESLCESLRLVNEVAYSVYLCVTAFILVGLPTPGAIL